MKPTHKRSLVWRVGVGVIVVETMIALLIGVYAYNNLKAFQFDGTKDRLRSVCSVIAVSYVDPLKANDRDRLRDLVAAQARESGLRVTVLTVSGEVLDDSRRDSALMDNQQGPRRDPARDRGRGGLVRSIQ